ncbi:hypothetical protein [Corallococcus sp. AS-1-12]|uniref:hypothetical protein n=1 Tax=Corallococcus sp. AS-1-12 TaxID=2874598 RepID=UPI001CC1BB7B|nr:hypothetical protein [Corallococcus sp. AS-1-12]MBZ4330298.1 hypothetical protein [Corallococcus sp. AS-1-12]
MRLSDLDEEDELLLEDGHCFHSQTLALCTRVGARRRAPGPTLALAWRPGHPRAEALRTIAGTLRSVWPGTGRGKVSAGPSPK